MIDDLQNNFIQGRPDRAVLIKASIKFNVRRQGKTFVLYQ